MYTQTIAYSVEQAEDVFDEIAQACGEWWYESSFFQNTGMEYRPNNPQLKRLLPLMRCLVGRDSEGNVASAYVGIPSDYMFNPEWTVMNEIVWYIKEEYRGVRSLIQLFNEVRDFCNQEQVDMWSISIPSFFRSSGVEKLMSKQGYFLQDLKYVRVSDE